MIDPGSIPQFMGNLGAIEAAGSALSTLGGTIETRGAHVHSTFQGLAGSYHAPEAQELFDSTRPVEREAAKFGGNVTAVGAALTQFAHDAQPIVQRLQTLKVDATAFVNSIQGDKDWTDDGGKVDHNNQLLHDVNAAYVQFLAVEAAAANKIQSLYGGRLFHGGTPSKDDPYAYMTSIPDNMQTPWGTKEQESHWHDKAIHWVDHHLPGWAQPMFDTWAGFEKGFWIDGVWGTVKGLGLLAIDGFLWQTGTHDLAKSVAPDLVNQADGAAKGLAYLAADAAIWSVPGLGATMTAASKSGALPKPVSDFVDKSNQAGVGFLKGLVAWDEWGKDPARASGAVTFNVLSFLVPGPKGAGAMLKGTAEAADLGAVGLGEAADLGTRGAADAADLGAHGVSIGAEDAAAGASHLEGPTVADLADNVFGTRDVDSALSGAGDLERTAAGLDDLGKTDIPSLGDHPVTTDPVPVSEHPGGTDPVPAGAHPGGTDPVPAGAHPGGTDPVPVGAHPGGTDPVPVGAHPGGTDPVPVGAHPGGTDPVPAGSHPGGTDPAPVGDHPGGTDPAPAGDHPAPGDGAHQPHVPDQKDTPGNDPNLAKHDPSVGQQVGTIRDQIKPDLQRAADDAWQHGQDRLDNEHPDLVGTAQGDRITGTYAHSYLKDWINAHGDRLVHPDSGYRIRSEVGFDKAGNELLPGASSKGSIRPDVILEREHVDPLTGDPNWQVVHAYDLKTGVKGITPGWADQVMKRLDPLAPPEELRPTPPSAAPPAGPGTADVAASAATHDPAPAGSTADPGHSTVAPPQDAAAAGGGRGGGVAEDLRLGDSVGGTSWAQPPNLNGDFRLGPEYVNTDLMQSLTKDWQAVGYGHMSHEEFLTKWTDPETGGWRWDQVPNDGFAGGDLDAGQLGAADHGPLPANGFTEPIVADGAHSPALTGLPHDAADTGLHDPPHPGDGHAPGAIADAHGGMADHTGTVDHGGSADHGGATPHDPAPPRTFATNPDGAAYGRSVWSDAQHQMTPAERDAMRGYTNEKLPGEAGPPDYKDINGFLRGHTPGTPEVESAVRNMDQALHIKPVPEDVMVTRETGLNAFDRDPIDLPGSIQEDKGYLSTALGPDPTFNPDAPAVIHLRVPAGTPAMYMDGVSIFGGERELLLGHGLSYQVDSVVRAGGRWQVYAHIVRTGT